MILGESSVFQDLKMGVKIGSGYLLVTLVLATTVLITLVQITRARTVVEDLVNRSAPTFQASLRITNGLNKSLGKLRGGVLRGEESLKTTGGGAGVKKINPAMKELKGLVKDHHTLAAHTEFVEEKLVELKK